MEDLAPILLRDYGIKPRGKSASMSASPPVPIIRTSSSPGKLENGSNLSSRSSARVLGESLHVDVLFEANGRKSASDRSILGSGRVDLLSGSPVSFDDVFGGPPKFAPPSYSSQLASSQSSYDIFSVRVKTSTGNKGSSFPVFDAPLHDDDTFGGVQGIRSAAGAHGVFSGSSTAGLSPADPEDLLSGFSIADSTERSTNQWPASDSETPSAGAFALDELLPGFFGTERTKPRSAGEGNPAQQKSSGLVDGFPAAAVRISALTPPSVLDLDPLKDLASPSGGRYRNGSCNGVAEGTVAFQNSSPPSPAASNAPKKAVNTVMAIPTPNPRRMSAIKESGNGDSPSRSNSNNDHVEDHSETSSNSPKPQPDVYVDNAESASTDSPSRRNRRVPCEAAVFPQNHRADDSIQMQKTANRGHVDEIWISIKDVKLVTRPTLVPPPSRPPPKPRSKQGYASRKPSYSKTEVNHDSVTDSNGFAVARETGKTFGPSSHIKARTNKFTSAVDELDVFASGGSRIHKDGKRDVASPVLEEKLIEGNGSVRASSVALKGARAGAKLRLSEEVQEKEKEEKDREAGAARIREEQVKAREVQERGDKMAREKEKKEKARQREEKERESRAIRRREERERELRHRKETDNAAAEAQERAKRAAAEKAATAREQQDASLDEHHVFSTDGQPRSSDVSLAAGGLLAPGDFPEVEGESAERRRSRLERHVRILERSATALHEKNQRDLQSQKDQAERHRAAETLDIKIKRWAAGKEGNIRALLSTLQYVLWPESGWKAVSLGDLISAAAVKQAYRKATVCVHPDKLQQRGATILQKYTAEKVFHLLNEAWNKFKSGELFERVN